MSDFKKVIKGLECCSKVSCIGQKCPYHHEPEEWREVDCNTELSRDALELLKERGWISVKDRLPEYRKWVLCKCRAGIYEVLRLDNNDGPSWYHDNGHAYLFGFVTHWMPLPEPPKEEA